LSKWGWGQADEGKGEGETEDDGMKSTCRPIRVEVWEVKDGVKGEVLGAWEEPVKSGYKGLHGMGVPEGER
jgi:hypothetical protein